MHRRDGLETWNDPTHTAPRATLAEQIERIL